MLKHAYQAKSATIGNNSSLQQFPFKGFAAKNAIFVRQKNADFIKKFWILPFLI